MLNKYRSQSDLTKAHIQMHLSILLWGLTGVLGRGIELNEGLLVWYRMLLVTASLFIYVRLTNASLRVSSKNLRQLVFIGILLMAHWILFYGAIKHSNVSVTLSLFSSTAIFTALTEPLITKKKFNKTELLYSAMAMAGIGIIFYTDENSFGAGMILALLAAFVGAFFNILNKNVVHEVQSSVVSFYEILAGWLALTPLLPFYLYFFPAEKMTPSLHDWLLLGVLSLLCTHITLILSLNALKHLSAFTLNLAINLEPIYGITLAFLIFGENKSLNKWFFLGASVILLSVALHSYFSSKNEVPERVIET